MMAQANLERKAAPRNLIVKPALYWSRHKAPRCRIPALTIWVYDCRCYVHCRRRKQVDDDCAGLASGLRMGQSVRWRAVLCVGPPQNIGLRLNVGDGDTDVPARGDLLLL